ncbi:MAG: Ca-activated chloride channel family protein [Pirellulaceae bacterium]|jgi:Ca-activated chloride channel family protein
MPKKRQRRRVQLSQRKGSVIALVVTMMIAFIAASAISIDFAYMQLVQTQLRSATDAAARAGGEALSRGLSEEEVRQEVKDIAELNSVAGAPLLIRDQEIIFGRANSQTNARYLFAPNATPINAVQVIGRRTDSSASGNVNMMLGPFFGKDTFQTSKSAVATIQDRDIAMVIDRSGSMDWVTSRSDKTKRMVALKKAIKVFRRVLDQTIGQEQLAITSYSSSARIDSSLALDYEHFDKKIKDTLPSGATNIGSGIKAAQTVLTDITRIRPTAKRVMIVMTDGQHNTGKDPEQAAREARAAMNGNLIIHTITFSSGADISRMQRVAAIGDGLHVHADNSDELEDKFELIARAASGILID